MNSAGNDAITPDVMKLKELDTMPLVEHAAVFRKFHEEVTNYLEKNAD